jgi:hypothetical protein
VVGVALLVAGAAETAGAEVGVTGAVVSVVVLAPPLLHPVAITASAGATKDSTSLLDRGKRRITSFHLLFALCALG